MGTKILCGALAAGAMTLTAMPSEAALQLYYDFNGTGTGTTEVNQGVAGAFGNLSFVDADKTTPVDLFGAAGSGVSGLDDDRALDLSRYEFGSAAGYAITAGSGSDLGLRGNDGEDTDQYTYAAWYKITGGYRNNARLVGGENEIRANSNAGQFTLSSEADYDSGADGAWQSNGEWVFIAMVIDEVGDTFSWYRGSTTESVTLVQQYTKSTTPAMADNTIVPTLDSEIVLGNRVPTNDRVLDGLIDNVRFYNDALDLESLEALRVADVPEPASLALLGLGGALVLGRRR